MSSDIISKLKIKSTPKKQETIIIKQQPLKSKLSQNKPGIAIKMDVIDKRNEKK